MNTPWRSTVSGDQKCLAEVQQLQRNFIQMELDFKQRLQEMVDSKNIGWAQLNAMGKETKERLAAMSSLVESSRSIASQVLRLLFSVVLNSDVFNRFSLTDTKGD